MPRTGKEEDPPAPTKACTDQRKFCLGKGAIIILIIFISTTIIIIILFAKVSERSSLGGRTPLHLGSPPSAGVRHHQLNVSECSSSGGRTPLTRETSVSLV